MVCFLSVFSTYTFQEVVKIDRNRFQTIETIETTLTSPYASGRYRGQYRKRGSHDLRRRRHGLGVVVSAASAGVYVGASLRRLDELILGRDPGSILLQELQDYAVGPAET